MPLISDDQLQSLTRRRRSFEQRQAQERRQRSQIISFLTNARSLSLQHLPIIVDTPGPSVTIYRADSLPSGLPLSTV